MVKATLERHQVDDRTALRLALGDFQVAMPPDVALRIAAASMRLAAACYMLARTKSAEGSRAAATELLLLLAGGIGDPAEDLSEVDREDLATLASTIAVLQ